MTVLPPFPTRGFPGLLTVDSDSLREATMDDLPFLRELYASFRSEELAALDWPEETKRAFLNQQFDFQHRHYMLVFPDTDFLIVEERGTPIGRLYIDLSKRPWHIVDIGLLPDWRGWGKGSNLLKQLRLLAIEAGTGLMLHVAHHNVRAQGFYRRLSFREVESTSTHMRMEFNTASPQLKTAS